MNRTLLATVAAVILVFALGVVLLSAYRTQSPPPVVSCSCRSHPFGAGDVPAGL